MRPKNYKTYISPKHAIGSRKTRGTGAVILGKLQMTGGAYEDHRPNITSPVWPCAPTRRLGFATAGGLCYASSGSDSTDSTRFPAVVNVLVVDAEEPSAAVKKASTLAYP
jgi:amidase